MHFLIFILIMIQMQNCLLDFKQYSLNKSTLTQLLTRCLVLFKVIVHQYKMHDYWTFNIILIFKDIQLLYLFTFVLINNTRNLREFYAMCSCPLLCCQYCLWIRTSVHIKDQKYTQVNRNSSQCFRWATQILRNDRLLLTHGEPNTQLALKKGHQNCIVN